MSEPATSRLAFPPWLADKIRQSPCDFIVTGGGGWIGQAALEMLEAAMGNDIEQRLAVFGSTDRALHLRSGRALRSRALGQISDISYKPKIFIHCAFLTKDKLLDQSVENFVAANQKISGLVTEAAEKADTRGFFAPSSGAVYKKGTYELDDDLQTNTYGAMKIRDEDNFTRLALEKKIPLCMPRLFNLSGPFINKLDTYALSSMIMAALHDKPIIIRAAHRVLRSYIHVADLLALVFAMLLEPQTGGQPIWDTAGNDIVELNDLAQSIRAVLGRPILEITRPVLIEGRDDLYTGDATAMRQMLQARGMVLRPLENQIRDTADYMQISASVAHSDP